MGPSSHHLPLLAPDDVFAAFPSAPYPVFALASRRYTVGLNVPWEDYVTSRCTRNRQSPLSPSCGPSPKHSQVPRPGVIMNYVAAGALDRPSFVQHKAQSDGRPVQTPRRTPYRSYRAGRRVHRVLREKRPHGLNREIQSQCESCKYVQCPHNTHFGIHE